MTVRVIQIDDALGKKIEELVLARPGKNFDEIVEEALAAYVAARDDAGDRIAAAAEQGFGKRINAR